MFTACVPFLVFFGVGVARALSSSGGASAIWGRVLVAGTIIVAGIALVVALIGFALVDGVEQGIPGDALHALNTLSGSTWVAFNAAFGVMMLGGAGLMIGQAGKVRWLGWVALVLGIALFIPYADFVALLLTPVWIVVVGHRRQPSPGRRSRRPSLRAGDRLARATEEPR